MIDLEYMDELQTGVGGIPGTFPTNQMVKAMYVTLPGAERFRFTRQWVNSIWFAYKDAILNKNMTPWPAGGTEVTNMVASNSGKTAGDVRLWFVTLKREIEDGKISPWYLNFEKENAPLIARVSDAFRDIGKKAGEQFSFLKLLTIGLTGAFILYAGSQILKDIKKKK